MGSCFSTIHAGSIVDQPTAMVVAPDGFLLEYSIPVTVSQVLGPNPMLLCNSNSLDYNEHIAALLPEETIELGQLYFILPTEKLNRVLSGREMAELAVRASGAMAGAGKRVCLEIVPVNSVEKLGEYENDNEFKVGKKLSTIEEVF